ncbi:hypothetical protein CEXT_197421 [Caerostris extrusa]|uniref:Uncharacterized protein n=1 Tax=Caerostris extrusa TaxID=172846 RepID=A0AAV4VH35_CAEEX|nr:hypothetical protein CEXT_197421 [Caerostris extrusa]
MAIGRASSVWFTRKEAGLGFSYLAVMEERFKDISFTNSYTRQEFLFCFPLEKTSAKTFSFVHPFDMMTWILLLVTLMVVSLELLRDIVIVSDSAYEGSSNSNILRSFEAVLTGSHKVIFNNYSVTMLRTSNEAYMVRARRSSRKQGMDR